MEGVVDVFQVVKALRMQKPGAVLNVVSMGSTESAVQSMRLMLPLFVGYNYVDIVAWSVLHICHWYWIALFQGFSACNL